jgi:ribose transport system substrate-binding protein
MADSFRAEIKAKYPDIKVLDTQMEGFEPSAAESKAVGSP